MKNTMLWLALAASLSCAAGAMAADARTTVVIRDYTDVVAPADQAAYEAGIKSFNQCLAKHGYKYSWTAWTHETGDTYAYSYTSDPMPWQAFDAMQAAGKACDQAIRTGVNPHLRSETSAFMEARPDLSHMPQDASLNSPYIEVIYFKLKPGHDAHQAFVDVTKKIAAAADKAKWPNSYSIGEVRHAGEGAADFVIVLPSKSWAEVGKEPDTPLWTMVEGVYGKADAQAMRKSFNDAMQESSSHIDSYNAELTYKASK
ncbi:hypothetical protein DVT68_07225 [Dyella solisilvae]|uniref:Uncharacterized protein n=1 Tax=Dyella solisilvae TaxID=1920168 RepID=A0A370KD66_9GAMM|nr:hypothetical protein [Dyella solisilvae]RDJ00570.1 hypothetical protein DVT68_07225 [Dyella solisilvae]